MLTKLLGRIVEVLGRNVRAIFRSVESIFWAYIAERAPKILQLQLLHTLEGERVIVNRWIHALTGSLCEAALVAPMTD